MQQPFFERLAGARRVLLAGMGGGFDIFCGLPLWHHLRAQGCHVELANLSFTQLGRCRGEFPVPWLLRVTPDTEGPRDYFPELQLARWLQAQGTPQPVYALARLGGVQTLECYRWLVRELEIDTVLLVDGGTDSLMTGNEDALGTPQEDAVSLWAASQVPGVERRLLALLGFGIDHFHGVSHWHFLENVAALMRSGSFLGSWSLPAASPAFLAYREACEFAYRDTPGMPSIVNTSIVSAVEGCFGDHQVTRRTRGSELFINPLMSLYWGFDLEGVARANLYLNTLADTTSWDEVSYAIENFSDRLLSHRARRPLPL